jgi:hypothetical protein
VAVDVGAVGGSLTKWLEAGFHGLMAEYFRKQIGEKSLAAQARAVARGVAPFPHIPPGYERGEDGCLVPNGDAPTVAEAFRMRAEGATIREIHTYLKGNGIVRNWSTVKELLKNRLYLGEIRHGKLENLKAHEPIVGPGVWRAAQRTVIRGPQPRSDRLLARLGVLRCGSCGARLIVSSQSHKKRYPMYRCPTNNDCTKRVSISAELAEQVVTDAVRAALADVEGRASAEDGARKAEQELAAAQGALDAAVRAFDVLGDVESARERLRELRAAVDDAQARVDQLGPGATSISINGAEEWEKLTHDEQRELIRLSIRSAVVGPGRGAERITITTA